MIDEEQNVKQSSKSRTPTLNGGNEKLGIRRTKRVTLMSFWAESETSIYFGPGREPARIRLKRNMVISMVFFSLLLCFGREREILGVMARRGETRNESWLTRTVTTVFGFVRNAEFEILFFLFFFVAYLLFKDIVSFCHTPLFFLFSLPICAFYSNFPSFLSGYIVFVFSCFCSCN